MRKIEGVQRKTARFVMADYSKDRSVSDMLRKLEWPPLESGRVKET